VTTLSDSRSSDSRSSDSRSLAARTAYDPDDIFGVRRALGALSAARRDEFFDQWVALTESCGYEVPRIHDAVRARVTDPEATRGATGADPLSDAWRTVGSAMSAYLEWRGTR